MQREELKQALEKLGYLLDQLEDDAGQVSGKLGLLFKGHQVHNLLQDMHMTDALEMYGRMTEEKQEEFRAVINKGD
jgi:uncharacterized protein YpbB